MVGMASNEVTISADKESHGIGRVVSPLNESVNVPEPPLQLTLWIVLNCTGSVGPNPLPR